MFTSILFFVAALFAQQEPADIEIKEPWIRPGAKDMATAFYFVAENNSEKADTLYKAVSDIAGKVEIHETFKKDDMMGMREVEYIVIPPKSEFRFKPGAHHIMLMKLKKDLLDGNEEVITLYFKNSGEHMLKVKVKKN